jgi:hypothetical protein
MKLPAKDLASDAQISMTTTNKRKLGNTSCPKVNNSTILDTNDSEVDEIQDNL